MRRTGCSFEEGLHILAVKTETEKEKSFGDKRGSGTPGHISNPVVKAASADGTWRATSRESRSLPKGFFLIQAKS